MSLKKNSKALREQSAASFNRRDALTFLPAWALLPLLPLHP